MPQSIAPHTHTNKGRNRERYTDEPTTIKTSSEPYILMQNNNKGKKPLEKHTSESTFATL